MFVSATSPIVFYEYNFVLICFNLLLCCFFAEQGSGSFFLSTGLWEWKITNAHPILQVMFKDVLRTFEAEILKIFEDIQPKNRKKECALPALTAEYPAILKQHP